MKSHLQYFVLLCLLLPALLLIGCSKVPEDPLRQYESQILAARLATLESAAEPDKVPTLPDAQGAYDSLQSFRSILPLLEPAGRAIPDSWSYRLTFSPKAFTETAEELVILFHRDCLSINGTAYIHTTAPHKDLLQWAENKYSYLSEYDFNGAAPVSQR
ncbi:MAG: hypothetical protein II979_00500 [Clostridia bacterium]|nr:hypothetical protein [Clostridia bacterium]